jgi:glutaredoxin
MHRVVKEVLEKLVFSCPKCKDVKRTYTEINKHLLNCDGEEQSMKDEVAIESFKKAESVIKAVQN